MFAKKSLGQHFLRSRAALEKIAAAPALTPTDVVLEVGPGEGALTVLLLERAGKVVAVEKDARLIPILQEKFAREIAAGKLGLVHADILEIKTPQMFRKTAPDVDGLQTSGAVFPAAAYKIVANLPYYITGQFLRKFLQTETQPSMMVLLLQREVAKRITATDKKESILSLSVKCYGAPRYITTVKAGSFSPPPKVDSAILAIEDISKDFFTGGGVVFSEETFFTIIKKGFAHPRKLLSNNLDISASVLEQCGIHARARAENVSLEQWKCIASASRSA